MTSHWKQPIPVGGVTEGVWQFLHRKFTLLQYSCGGDFYKNLENVTKRWWFIVEKRCWFDDESLVPESHILYMHQNDCSSMFSFWDIRTYIIIISSQLERHLVLWTTAGMSDPHHIFHDSPLSYKENDTNLILPSLKLPREMFLASIPHVW